MGYGSEANIEQIQQVLASITLGNLELRQWASGAQATSQFGSGESWSPMQATGIPDTLECGDRATAWASSSSVGQDSITLEFAQSVIPTEINIYQSYTPGSIIRVEVFNSETPDLAITLPDSADPVGNTPCPGVFTLAVGGIDTPVNRVTIYLDQTLGGSWNEIDAVELVGDAAMFQQWATTAEATSQYGDPSWSAMQATGAPDTFECGDFSTAWASGTSTGMDTLTVGFETPVIPTQISIYQTYTPGSIISVELVSADGSMVIPVPDSADPVGNTPCPGVFTLNITDVTVEISQVRISVDQTLGGSWNEIDAVELIGIPAE